MKHPDEKKLLQFLEDELSDSESQEIDQHLSRCDQCRNSADTIIGSTVRIIGILPSGEPANPSAPAPGREQSIEAELALRFTISEEIARGGMGIIYRGFDRDLSREVAIKVSLDDTPESNARFYREAKISAQLQHPGVVPVHELGRLSDGKPYIVMRLIGGQTLQQLIRDDQSQRPSQKLLNVFESICSTMAFAHSRLVLHRDLKPDNVMVGSFGEVQVMDWGLAKKISQPPTSQEDSNRSSDTNFPSPDPSKNPTATQKGQILGTPAYMAPEQARGEAATLRSDVFSLGGILCHILTGKTPFADSTSTQAIARSASSDLERTYALLDRCGADKALIDLAKQCLTSDPKQRPTDSQQVSQRFNEYKSNREQERQSLKLEEARHNERMIAQKKRSRQLAVFLLGILVALGLSATAGMMYLSEKNARLAKQAEIERENLEARVRNDLLLRKSIDRITRYQNDAVNADVVGSAEIWALALKEVEKGTSFLSDSIDSDLHAEFTELAAHVRTKAEFTKLRRDNFNVDQRCQQKLLGCCEESYYPEDLKRCRNAKLTSRIAAAFREIKISPEEDIEEAVARIASSEFSDDLLHGLLVWRRENSIESKSDRESARSESVLELERKWLDDLIDRADPDEFRSQLRQLYREEKFDSLANILKLPEAVDSLKTIYVAANMVGQVHTKQEPRIAYLRRAQQAFPMNFFTNWYLVSMTGDKDVQVEFAMPSYALRPDNAGVLAAVGVASIREDEFNRAIEALEQLIEMEPLYWPGVLNLAIAYGSVDRKDLALEFFEKSLEMDSPVKQTDTVHKFRGRFFRDRKDFDNAIQDFQQWVHLAPDSAMAHDSLAVAYNGNEMVELAVATQLKAIDLRPDYKWYHRRLHDYYVRLCEQLDKEGLKEELAATEIQAIEEFKKIIARVPKVASPYEQLALFCQDRKIYPQAIDALRQAVLLRPDYDSHKNRMSNVTYDMCDRLENENKLEEGVKAFRETIDFLDDYDPEHKRILRLLVPLAGFLRKLGRFDESITATKRIVSADPENRFVLESLGHLYVYNEQLDLAEQAFLDLQEKFEDDDRAVACLANLHLVKRNPDKSLAIIEAAFLRGIDSPEIQLMYGKSLISQGLEKEDSTLVDQGRQILRELKKTHPQLIRIEDEDYLK